MSVADPDSRRGEPATAPERSRAATRGRLVAAGTELFARDGLHRVTSAQIARHAGVATGTFYLHFRDKKQLFREIVFEAVTELRRRSDAAAAGAGSGAEAEIRARAGEFLAFAEAKRNLVRVLFGRDAEPDVAEDVLESVVPGVEERLRLRGRAGQTPEGVHPAVAAQALVAMWTRVVRWWIEDPDRAPRDAVIETMTRLHPGTQAGKPESR